MSDEGTTPATPATPPADPDYRSVRDHLLYGLSLPERTLRGGAGLVGGTLREGAALLVPQAFQSSKTYSVLVRQTLDFLVEDVGGMSKPPSAEGAAPPVENFVARKAVGSFLDMAGLATLHLSPVLLLAVVSDVAYGSQTYLKELAQDLREQGVIDEHSTIDHADDLLDAVARASGTLATAFDAPPLSVEGLRKTIDDTRQAVREMDPRRVIPQAEMARLWEDMHAIALQENVTMLEVSSAMTLATLDKLGAAHRGALSTVRVAGSLFDRCLIDHYKATLVRIQQRGFFRTVSETSGPYVEAVWQNYSREQPTITEGLFSGRLVGQAWTAARRWMQGAAPGDATPGNAAPNVSATDPVATEAAIPPPADAPRTA